MKKAPSLTVFEYFLLLPAASSATTTTNFSAVAPPLRLPSFLAFSVFFYHFWINRPSHHHGRCFVPKKNSNKEKEQKFVRQESNISINLKKRVPAFQIVWSFPVAHPFVIIVTTLIVSPSKTNQNNRKPVFCLKVGQLQKKKIEQVRGGGTKWYCCCWKNLLV